MRWAGYVEGAGEIIMAYELLFGKPEGRRPHERHRCRWKDNIKINMKEKVFMMVCGKD
jgi:hypothetical protein